MRRISAIGTALAVTGGLLLTGATMSPATADIRPSVGDRDGDGLPDRWESEGVDTNGDGVIDLDLPALGADPDRADLFVELDYMVVPRSGARDLLPSVSELDTIVQTFADLPVSNPDGSTGITAHLDAGPTRGPAYDLGGGSEVPYRQNIAGVSTVSQLRQTHSARARNNVFHYTVFADSYGADGSSGQAWRPGLELLVTLGPTYWPTANSATRVGTFIHEIGHNFGLRHGGSDEVNYKPNYTSVMNYTYQTIGVPRTARTPYFGYSTRATTTLDENALDESAGLGGTADGFEVMWWTSGTRRQAPASGPIDWNVDGVIARSPVALDLNRSSSRGTLIGPNDLNLMNLDVGTKGDSRFTRQDRTAQPEVSSNELTADVAERLFGDL